VTLFLGALVSVLFLASDRIRMSMAVRRARKRIAVLEREVAQLRAIPLKPLKALEEGRPEPEKEVSSAPGVIAAGPAGSSEPTDPSEGKNPAQNNNQAGDKESGSVEKL
ncbi:MAG: LapA family protein, partial [Desulfovibrionaceae bacterium]|nr:LapA family protein [Desulfovibrionaceae bacterium]